jgi:two-component sensor histidine kinase
MREVSHRAKNMLSLVQAIARQTAAREPEDFIGRFTERIQALAANQDLLVRNKWQGVDTEDLVRAQLAPFADLIESRIAVHGPKLRLNAAAAQAVGLALHELATNAGKYGALSTDAGRVDVGWRLGGDIFAMSWTERDGPPVRPPERLASAARSSIRWRSGPSAVKSSLITLHQVSSGA